jgi:hypothetical protein
MPDLTFQILGVEPVENGLAPLLHFRLRAELSPGSAEVRALLLQAQIQIQAAQRPYAPGEQERLLDLFGTPDRWGQTLRNRFWTNTNAMTGAFTGSTEVVLPVACTFDLNVLATKYFQALGHESEVPLLFLFSGSVFYAAEDGRLQAERISWDKECVYRMPVRVWQEAMERHFPNSAWVSLRRDVFERLCAYKRAGGLATWEETIERLLPQNELTEAVA